MKKPCILFLVCLSPMAAAQVADTTYRGSIREVTIHEHRAGVAVNAVPSLFIHITDSQIQASPATSIAEILGQYAGLDIRSRGAQGVQSDPGIRGSGFGQVAILINGIRVSDPQTGHHSLNLPLDLSAVNRIEVYKGPSARIFGQNSFAGAINIITRIPEQDQWSVRAMAGDFGLAGGGISTAFHTGKVSSFLSLDHQRSAGYRYNTDYRLSHLFIQSETEAGPGRLSLIAGISVRDFGANGFYASPENKDQYEALETSLLSLSYNRAWGEKLKLMHRGFWRRNRDEYLFIRNDPGYYRNLHLNHTAGYQFDMTLRTGLGITGLGIEINRVSLVSNRLGDRNRVMAAFLLDHRFHLLHDRLQLSPGLQYNVYSDFGNRVLPGVDISYDLSPVLMAFLNSGFTYRVPSYTDLYYEDPANAGNPDLGPEYALSHELGIKTRGNTEGFQLQTSVFIRNEKNLIDRIRELETEKWTPVNIRKANVHGWELSLGYHSPGNGWIQSARLEYTFLRIETTGDIPEFSRYALEFLRHHVTGSLEMRYLRRLSHTLKFRFAERVNLDPYAVADTRMTLNLKKFRIYLDICNIFNVSYVETNLVEMPGRWASLGLEYRIRK